MSIDPAELLAMVVATTEAVKAISAAMNEGVAVMVADGWTEEQARQVVVTLVTRQTSAEPDDEQEKG